MFHAVTLPDAEYLLLQNRSSCKYVSIDYHRAPDAERLGNLCTWLTQNHFVEYLTLAFSVSDVSGILRVLLRHNSIKRLKLCMPTVRSGDLPLFEEVASSNNPRIEKILLVRPVISLSDVEPLVNPFRNSSVELQIYPDILGRPIDSAFCTARIPSSVWLFKAKSWGILKSCYELNRPAEQEEELTDEGEAANQKISTRSALLQMLPVEIWLLILSFLEDAWDIQSVRQSCALFYCLTRDNPEIASGCQIDFESISKFSRRFSVVMPAGNWVEAIEWIKMCPSFMLNMNCFLPFGDWNTPLRMAISNQAPPKVIDLLLEKGADKNMEDAQGYDDFRLAATSYRGQYASSKIQQLNPGRELMDNKDWRGITTRNAAGDRDIYGITDMFE